MSDLSPILALPALLALLLLPACSTTTTAGAGLPPLQTVESVDLQRYLGTWYEIASFPQSFQRGCTDAGVIERLVAQGYDTARLVRTLQ